MKTLDAMTRWQRTQTSVSQYLIRQHFIT
jgi:hypothetical protein